MTKLKQVAVNLIDWLDMMDELTHARHLAQACFHLGTADAPPEALGAVGIQTVEALDELRERFEEIRAAAIGEEGLTGGAEGGAS